MTIAVIAGTKASDAYLCRELIKQFPHIRIICYKIPVRQWIPWLKKRIAIVGGGAFIGHFLLSAYLRIERFGEWIRGKSLWRDFQVERPIWRRLSVRPTLCLDEQQLIELCTGADVVVSLDSFRYTSDFFRQIKVPFLHVVWGAVPKYFGDSGAYWAHVTGDREHVGVSIVLRTDQFREYRPLAWMPIATTAEDTLRTIKVKQVITLGQQLPQCIRNAQQISKEHARREIACRNWYAPTLHTVLAAQNNANALSSTTPAYAYRDYTGIIFE